MKKNLSLHKLLGIIAIIGVVSSTSVSAFASDVTPVENSSSSELDPEAVIQPRAIYHDYNNFVIQGRSSFPGIIKLSNSEPYGKVHYYNNTSSDVTMNVVGEGIITIGAYSGGSIVWKKSLFKRNYDYHVTSKSGYLNGSLSVAKASELSEFQ